MKTVLTWLTGKLRFYHGEGKLRQALLTLSGIMVFMIPVGISSFLGLVKMPKFMILAAIVVGILGGLVVLALAWRSADRKRPDLPLELVAESLSDPIKGLLLFWPLSIFCATVGAFSSYMCFSGEIPASIVWDFVMAFFMAAAGAPAYFWFWRRRWVKHESGSAALELGTGLGGYRRVESIELANIEGLILMRAERGMLTRWFVSINVRGESAPRRLLETPYLDEAEEASKKLEKLMAVAGKKIPVTRAS